MVVAVGILTLRTRRGRTRSNADVAAGVNAAAVADVDEVAR
jgi:hypothetical protein